jgi:hypothetical protein
MGAVVGEEVKVGVRVISLSGHHVTAGVTGTIKTKRTNRRAFT